MTYALGGEYIFTKANLFIGCPSTLDLFTEDPSFVTQLTVQAGKSTSSVYTVIPFSVDNPNCSPTYSVIDAAIDGVTDIASIFCSNMACLTLDLASNAKT